ESPQFFIGAKGGYQWASDDSYLHAKPRGAIYGAYGGVQFTPAWSWDVGYQYHDDLEAKPASINVKTWLIESALRYDWYLQDNLSVYGRLGAAYWDVTKTDLSVDRFDDRGFSPLGEIGLSYNFTPNARVSAGYQYINSVGNSSTGEYDSHGVLVGFTYTFGHQSQVQPQPRLAKKPPAPVKQAVMVKRLPQKMTFSSKSLDGFFNTNSAEPNVELGEQLKEVASVLKRYPQARAMVVGHTDSTGEEGYNQALSERRAQSVAKLLLDLGANTEQVKISGEAHNRRVDVTVPSFDYKK
ncbi:OmpA family protein, partial [Shewanella sp.]|nr:OmpA family protein [Shewanella sp.]